MSDRGRGGAALAWAALHQVEGIGAATMLRLARVFGSPEAALRASPVELTARARLSPQQAQDVKHQGDSLSALSRQLDAWTRDGVRLLPMDAPSYPSGLLDLRSPPPLLYLRGRLVARDARAVAVVGTREPTREGETLAERLAGGFAERGLTIVSGLARGIDRAGHEGALSSSQGRSVAVLGCGVLRVYPPEHAELADRIVGRGCLLAEVPPEAGVNRRLLLSRDRIQAALSRAVIVVQAHRECGSIVTARHARACGRLLFGVPWKSSPYAEGWERLREMGARPISAEDDLDALVGEILAPVRREQAPLP